MMIVCNTSFDAQKACDNCHKQNELLSNLLDERQQQKKLIARLEAMLEKQAKIILSIRSQKVA